MHDEDKLLLYLQVSLNNHKFVISRLKQTKHTNHFDINSGNLFSKYLIQASLIKIAIAGWNFSALAKIRQDVDVWETNEAGTAKLGTEQSLVSQLI